MIEQFFLAGFCIDDPLISKPVLYEKLDEIYLIHSFLRIYLSEK